MKSGRGLSANIFQFTDSVGHDGVGGLILVGAATQTIPDPDAKKQQKGTLPRLYGLRRGQRLSLPRWVSCFIHFAAFFASHHHSIKRPQEDTHFDTSYALIEGNGRNYLDASGHHPLTYIKVQCKIRNCEMQSLKHISTLATLSSLPRALLD